MEPPCSCKQLYTIQTIETIQARPGLYYSGICFPQDAGQEKKDEELEEFSYLGLTTSSFLQSHLLQFQDEPINHQKVTKSRKILPGKIFRYFFLSLSSSRYLGWLCLGFTMKYKQVKTGLSSGLTGLNRCLRLEMNHPVISCHIRHRVEHSHWSGGSISCSHWSRAS